MLRGLVADWKVALAVCFNLTIGLGSLITAFAMVDGLLFRPLPIREPNAFIHIESALPAGSISHPQYDDLSVASTTLEGIAAFNQERDVRVDVEGTTSVRNGLVVTENYFEILGVKAGMGRVFRSGDAAGEGKVVISARMWQGLCRSSGATIGSVIYLNGSPYVLIGVVSDGFEGTERRYVPDYWILRDQMIPRWPLKQRNLHSLSTIGRLKPGVSKKAAEEELNRTSEYLRKTYPHTDNGLTMKIRSDLEWNFSQNRSLAVQHMAIVALSVMLLSISAFNAKSLLIARMESQRQAVAIRLALGANRRSILGGFVTQSIGLAIVGGVFGSGLAYYALSLLNHQLWGAKVDFAEYILNWRTVWLIVVVSIVTGIVSGVAPALSALKMDLPTFLKGRNVSRKDSNISNVMCVLQVGLSLLLLVIAGLMAKSLSNAWAVKPGYDGKNLLLVKLDFKHHGKMKNSERLKVYRSLQEAIGALPGVSAVSWGRNLPMGGAGWTNVSANGNEPETASDSCRVDWLEVGPGFFETLGVRVIDGRAFEYSDLGRKFSEVDIIVNRAFVKRYWPGENPVGREFYPWGKSMPKQRIVGVVENFKTDLSDGAKPQLFTPALGDIAVFFIRCERDPSYLKSSIKKTVSGILPNVPLLSLSSYQEQIKESFSELRTGAIATGVIGIIGATLTAFGVFGFMFQWVVQRRREIAIRMAIGASGAAIVRHLFERAFWMVLVGMGIGLVGSIFGGRYLSEALYEVAPWDPQVMLFAALFLTVVTALAICIPAWTALRVNPLIALENE